MARFADLIFERTELHQASLLREFLNEPCDIVVADQTLDLFEGSDSSQPCLGLPSPFCPFQKCWIEWRVPPEQGCAEFMGLQIGCKLDLTENDHRQFEQLLKTHSIPPTHKILSTRIWARFAPYTIRLGAACFLYDEKLNLASEPILFFNKDRRDYLVETRGEEFQQDLETAAYHSCYTALYAFSLMNCRNVNLIEQVPGKNREARRYQVRTGRPLSTHYILNIQPMKRILQTEGNLDKVGINKALHSCRGHFRTYEESSKLFGKHAGTFWIPSHIRGSSENGEVRKWYSLGARRKDDSKVAREPMGTK
jgi:hypothetical protein